MFGYVKPYTPELKVRELELYRAAYCGLCQRLGKRYGFAARCALGYDFVFLTLLLSTDNRAKTARCRCPVSLRRKRCLTCGSADIAAAYCVILAYHKLRDDVADEGFARRTLARLASTGLHRAYRRAAADYPAFDGAVRDKLAKLRAVESDASRPLDECADAFASILAAAAESERSDMRRRVLTTLLYHVGRWVYLIDARDDLADDARYGRPNAVTSRFGGMDAKERDERLRLSLDNSMSVAGSALELLDGSEYSDILRNVVYLGLPAIQDAVFDGTYRAKARGDLVNSENVKKL